MPNNKAAGPDGLPAEFFKHFWNTISPLFMKMCQKIKHTSEIPQHMNSTLLSLLPKPDKDPPQCANYRPLSLINTDIKIISKALTIRIEKVIPHIIHPDQTGFIKGRHSSDNKRRLFNLITISGSSNLKTIITSLDAEKAFDRVNHTFLFSTLQKFGFGESFAHWIKTLYSSPMATVITNGKISKPFPLHRGTRQGCPVSPSLFAIFIEPLAVAIRQNHNIQGICVSNYHHKISLYADDILLYLQSTSNSLQEVIKLINQFSKISDDSINWTESIIMPLSGGGLDGCIPTCTPSLTRWQH